MKNEDIRNLKHGDKVSCYLDGHPVTGTISIENKGGGKYIVHLCQDVIEGTYNAGEMFGHKYSTIIGSVDNKFANYNKRIAELSILLPDEKPNPGIELEFKPMPERFEKVVTANREEKTKTHPSQLNNDIEEIESYTSWIQRREDAIAKAIANRARKLKEIPVDWINEYNNNLRHLAVTVVLVLFSMVTQAQVTKYIGHKYPSDTLIQNHCGYSSTIVFRKTSSGIVKSIIVYPGTPDTIKPLYLFQLEQLVKQVEKTYTISFSREYYPNCSEDAFLRARKNGITYEGYIEHDTHKSPGYLFALIISK